MWGAREFNQETLNYTYCICPGIPDKDRIKCVHIRIKSALLSSVAFSRIHWTLNEMNLESESWGSGLLNLAFLVSIPIRKPQFN